MLQIALKELPGGQSAKKTLSDLALTLHVVDELFKKCCYFDNHKKISQL
jgi:hypothetical protein